MATTNATPWASPALANRISGTPYRLLPFRFERLPDEEVLLTNEVGEFLVLPHCDLARLIRRELTVDELVFTDLEAKHFVARDDPSLAVELLATKLRTRKSYLEGFARLHIFVLTLRCDHSCRYCQVSRAAEGDARFDMSLEDAGRAVDLLFSFPAEDLKVEFQGGEPLLRFDLLRWITEAIEERNRTERRSIGFVAATNLAPLTVEMLDYFHDHAFHLSSSLDGPADLHDTNRPRPGRDSHSRFVDGLARARQALGHQSVSALMTTTERALAFPEEIVDEYVRLGFDTIFLRATSPYGFAARTGEAARIEAGRFVEFYRRALEQVFEWNRRGVAIREFYTALLTRRILTPFADGYVDLRSPAGAGFGAIVYNYDGDIYASDEARMLAEMGDRSFRLGSVRTDSFTDLVGSPVLHRIAEWSVLESMPGCCDCAYLPYCGADPIYHHRTQGDPVGHRPTSGHCLRHLGIFRHLFSLLRGSDAFVVDLLTSWAVDVPSRPSADPRAREAG